MKVIYSENVYFMIVHLCLEKLQAVALHSALYRSTSKQEVLLKDCIVVF